jgi:Tfp pilus assembly protein PilZ
VATNHILPIGEMVRVNFTLPTLHEQIEALTQVRWVRSKDVVGGGGGPGMGLMFLELSARAKEAIQSFLGQRDSLFFDAD